LQFSSFFETLAALALRMRKSAGQTDGLILRSLPAPNATAGVSKDEAATLHTQGAG